MNTQREQFDVEGGTLLRLIISGDSFEPLMTNANSVFIPVHSWREASFTLPINSRESLCVFHPET
jgi:hypothetical protein